MGRNLGSDLAAKRDWLERALPGAPDLVRCDLTLKAPGGARRALLVYVSELVDLMLLQGGVLEPLREQELPQCSTLEEIAGAVLDVPGWSYSNDTQEVIARLLRGEGLLLVDGFPGGLLLATQGGKGRSPDEPPAEPAVRGPRDGFVEHLWVNRSLIRRRLPDPALRFEAFHVGNPGHTLVEMAYLEGRAPSELLQQTRRRVQAVQTDGILDSGMLSEFLEDSPYSPFPQMQNTQRPDMVALALQEGRVAILVDQSPSVLLAPTVLWQLLQVSEDYYERWWAASMIRVVRAISVFVSLTLPGLWVSLISYHQELLPTPLALSIAAGRERVPLPAVLESFVLELAFEILREAGARLPRPVGQATSIVGGLVIGQAAVQAGLVAPSTVIIVAMTGLASFATPNFSAAYGIRVLRFAVLLLSGIVGVLGFGFAAVLIILHLVHLKSFGVEYLSPVLPYMSGRGRDVLIRKPWKKLRTADVRWWQR